ncbi:hypothetical protein [Sphingomonas sp.]|uniref:hypothetical protein n=1 Tax=Sphingomonas sp. TaxID=28214 RepID=UPI0025DD299D|nr:hypothetical protein [Sphingomonas sp.]
MGEASLIREAELALLNAPFDPDGWRRATELAAAATGSASANLIGLGGPLLLPFNIYTGPAGDRFSHYFENPEYWGECNWRVNCTTRPMEIQHEGHYRAYRATAKTERYDDAVADLDLELGCQAALLLGGGSIVGLAIIRGRREGPCSDTTLRRFRHLSVTAQRAVRMQLAIDNEAAEMMLGNMAAMRSATLLLDRHGNLAALTPKAETLFEDDGPLVLDGLAPRLRCRNEDIFLLAAMARLLAHDGHGAHVHQARVGRNSVHPYGRWRLYLVRLPARDHGLGFDPHLALTIKPAASDQ